MVAVRMARCPVWAIGGVLGTPPSNGAKVFGQRRPEGAARPVFLHYVAAWPLLIGAADSGPVHGNVTGARRAQQPGLSPGEQN